MTGNQELPPLDAREATIRILPEEIVTKLAAGEVIQHPAHVVKELIENSLDAGARTIHVRLENGGKDTICVQDDGCGMSPVDARLCFERHATSKIRDEKDLHRIHTLGFRGEALAAISRVSRVVLETRRAQDPQGIRVINQGGEVIRMEPCTMKAGTRVCVTSLFFNYPARRKALKDASRELQRILRVIYAWAIATPSVGYEVSHNQKLVLKLDPADGFRRIHHLFGEMLGNRWISLNEETPFIQISGWVFPETTLSSLHYLYINGRFAREPFLQQVIHRLIAREHRRIAYVLFIRVPPEWVDPNVHPAKEEVRFVDPQTVHPQIEHLLQQALTRSLVGSETLLTFTTGTAGSSSSFSSGESQPASLPSSAEEIEEEWKQTDPPSSRTPSFLANPETGTKAEARTEPGRDPGFAPVQNTFFWKPPFLITFTRQNFLLIHVPNALFRVYYDHLLRTWKKGFPGISQLSFSARTIEVPRVLQPHLSELLAILQRVGFSLRMLGPTWLTVEGIPAWLPGALARTESVLSDFFPSFLEAIAGNHTIITSSAPEKLLETLARILGSTTARDSWNPHWLLQNLFASPEPHHTPDGRPVLLRMSIEHLQRVFAGKKKTTRDLLHFHTPS